MFASTNYAGVQTQGSREYQEDEFGFYLTCESKLYSNSVLAVLCDGMGGANNGDFASKIAVSTFVDAFAGMQGSVKDKLIRALKHANRELGLAIEKRPELHGMGSTLVSVSIIGNKMHFISVGDSLIWLWRKGNLTRINAEHIYAFTLDEMAENGEISIEEAQSHPERFSLTSAIMGDNLDIIDTSPAEIILQDGDCVLLASDGVLSLSYEDISDILRRNSNLSAKELADLIVQAVDGCGSTSQDNATIQIIKPNLSLKTKILQSILTKSPYYALALAAILFISASYKSFGPDFERKLSELIPYSKLLLGLDDKIVANTKSELNQVQNGKQIAKDQTESENPVSSVTVSENTPKADDESSSKIDTVQSKAKKDAK